jgi:predicted nucleotidyltransferase component of viral defense system
VDISTGDAMTPDAVNCTFNGIFDEDLSFTVWAYNIETVMAEKVETILRRSVFNTRPRDYYDAYILFTNKSFDKALFWEALSATAAHRGTTRQIEDIPKSLNTIAESKELQNMWNGYRKQFDYAKDIHYEMIIGALNKLLNI